MVLAGLADGRGLDRGFDAVRSVKLEGRPELDPSLAAGRGLDPKFVLRPVGMEGQAELGSPFTALGSGVGRVLGPGFAKRSIGLEGQPELDPPFAAEGLAPKPGLDLRFAAVRSV